MSRILDWWLELRLRSWVDAAYFAIVSTTTVGYGDLVPRNEATKLFLIFYLPIGIGVGFTVLASVGAKILDAQRRRLERRHETMGEHPGHEDDPKT